VADYIEREPVEAIAELSEAMQEAAAEIFEDFDLTISRHILAAATEMFINKTQQRILFGFRQNMKDMLNHEDSN
jgi:hypothetical protein